MKKKKLFFGGPILTMDKKLQGVGAVGVIDEQIIAVGDLESVKRTLGGDFESIDLKGNVLMPGFIDCHIHPLFFLFFLVNPILSNVKSLEQLKKLLSEETSKKEKGAFILGLSLKEENFDKPTLPTRWDLDEACPDNPVFLLRYDGHIGIANTKALEWAGVTEDTVSPEGGEIRKDENGKINGIFSENAMQLIISKYKPSLDAIYNVAEKGFKILAEQGITTLHGIMQGEPGGEVGDLGAIELSVFEKVQDNILQNWYILLSTRFPNKLKRKKKPPLDFGKEDSQFKLGCLKLFLDGTFGAQTACMYEPFTDDPQKCGFCVVDLEEIYQKMKVAHDLGFQIGIHVIGDKGNRIAVNLFKRLLEESPRTDHRHRIEHASMLTDDIIRDMKELGIIASCQPSFINSEYTWLEKRLGKERCKYTYPMKSIIDAGVTLISGSDCPVESPSVIMGLHALVTRNGFVPEQCISIEEALKTYTINAAFASFEENLKGSIGEGKLADFVILDKNLLEVPNNEIKNIQVLETIIRGKTVYKKN